MKGGDSQDIPVLSLLLALSIENPSPSGQVHSPQKLVMLNLGFTVLGWQWTFQFSHEGPPLQSGLVILAFKETSASFTQLGRGKLDSNPLLSSNIFSANRRVESGEKATAHCWNIISYSTLTCMGTQRISAPALIGS